MAVVTGIVALDMRGMLAGRGRTIVTGGAGAGYIGVIEARRDPGTAGMAIIAGIVALDMRRMLAGRGRAIVTGGAGTANGKVIHACCWPAFVCMTGITILTAFYVLGMFFACAYCTACAMATGTLCRRSFEYSPDMTGLTFYGDMCAFEWKAGAIVVKLLCSPGRVDHDRDEYQA
jgi:hypothetical protein